MLAKKHWLLALVLILFTYIGVGALVAHEIGRTNPRIASYFKPPTFSFEGHYTEGEILEFEVGQPVDQVLRKATLEGYVVDLSCWGSRSGDHLAEPATLTASVVATKHILCFRRGRVFLRFELNSGSLGRATINFVSYDVVT